MLRMNDSKFNGEELSGLIMSGFMYNIVGFTSGSIAVSSRAAAAEAGEEDTTWSAAHESNRNKVSRSPAHLPLIAMSQLLHKRSAAIIMCLRAVRTQQRACSRDSG